MPLVIHNTSLSAGDLLIDAVFRFRRLFVGLETPFGRPSRRCVKRSREGYALPEKLRDTYKIEGETPVLSLRPQSGERSGRTVFFIHGGSFWHDPSKYHYLFVRRLCDKTGCTAVMPIYPKSPSFHNSDMLKMLLCEYDRLLDAVSPANIVMAGDSAGAALALSICQLLPREKRPARLLLLSPTGDCSLTNPDIREYERLDPMLSRRALLSRLTSYAGGRDLRDPRISPYFGELDGMGECLIIGGTHDILYPDALKLYGKLNADNTTFHVFPRQPHVFMLIPQSSSYSEAERLAHEFVK